MEKQSACPPARRGSGLIFAVVLLFVILGMVITLSSITVLETKMSQKTKSSVGAFYNSESGVEWALNKIATSTGTSISDAFISMDPTSHTVSSPSNPDYKVYLLDKDGNVIISPAELIANVKAVRSVGTKGDDTQRAIEAAVAAGEEKYDISCFAIDFSSPQTRHTCCRIDKESGDTKCYSRMGPGVAWTDLFALPSAGSNGKYSLSCFHFDDTTTRQECCRIDAESGNTKCYWREAYDGAWYSAPTPDLPAP